MRDVGNRIAPAGRGLRRDFPLPDPAVNIFEPLVYECRGDDRRLGELPDATASVSKLLPETEHPALEVRF